MANDDLEIKEYESTDQTGIALKNLINSVPLFSGFPEKLVNDLHRAAEVKHFDPDQVILNQGDNNMNLYFLIIGTVDVYVDGGLVASLRRKGDLLGEMSVITSRPVSATIIAKTPTELLCVNIDNFRKILGDNQDQFDHILYRIYSKILTDKVNITNQKAKRVEEMFADLEKAKNELQDINTQMERRVVERTQSIQSSLQQLLTQHLHPLKKSLKDATKQVDETQRPALLKSMDELDAVVQVLDPLVQRFNLEISMKSKAVLLAQAERRGQTISKMALGGTGVSIDSALTLEEASQKLADNKYDVVMVDAENFEVANLAMKTNPKTKVVFVAAKSIKDSLTQLQNINLLPNIVFIRDEDRAGSIRSIMTTVIKLCGPNIFGLEKYLNVGIEIKELPVIKSESRKDLIDDMKAHFSHLGVRSSVLDSVGVVAEELLMNAIYDAPCDPSGKPLYNSLPRTTPVTLKNHEQAKLRFATDGTLLAVSVSDPFGALPASTIINYLYSCYEDRAGSLQENKGGAGRGLHMIVENSLFVVFNVNPRRQTEAIAFFNVVPGAKEEIAPMLHYFVQ